MHVNANYCTASLYTPIKYVPNTGMTAPVTYVRYSSLPHVCGESADDASWGQAVVGYVLGRLWGIPDLESRTVATAQGSSSQLTANIWLQSATRDPASRRHPD
jgi:hypothetical protein